MFPGWLALAVLGALPASEQLTLPSLPKGLGEAVQSHGGLDAFAVLDVRRFPGQKTTLWVIGLPCADPARLRESCENLVYLQQDKRFTVAGRASGALIEVDSAADLPDALYFYAGRGHPEIKLERREGQYRSSTIAHLFRDPLTRDRLTAAQLRERAFADLTSGNSAAAAGRYTLLCEAQCTVGDLEALASAAMLARLFPQAEKALRAAVAQPGHLPDDWKQLGTLLRAAGKNGEAEDAETHFALERGDGGV